MFRPGIGPNRNHFTSVARQGRCQPGGSVINISLVSQTTFPDHNYSPAEVGKLIHCHLVSPDVAIKLFIPELRIRSGSGCVFAASMSMPKTTMNEYDCLVFRKHEVRRPRKSLDMQSIAEPKGVQVSSHHNLRPGILASDTGHHS